jgi:hypothetical protein
MKQWSGDGTYYLPARQVEPYRLWFEFLKLAHTDPDVSVNYDHYADWGDFYDQSFTGWWSGPTWRTLFAVDAGVRVLGDDELVFNDQTRLTVRLPLTKDPKEVLRDVAELLEQHGATDLLHAIPQGKFGLTAGYEKGFLKYLPQARLMLRLYRIWLSHRDIEGKGRVGQTAVDFVNWAKPRDEMIKIRKYKLERPLIPYAVSEFASDVIKGEYPDDNHRRAFLRYLKKAKTLAENAASGSFPGKW